ncbi:MAG TPA: class I SAM-dependent methyltransferase [Solirubrobacteraceae bacterium]|nr:class I SAM-dependent methyltransferase [Solirubrobacteraceae bacterium]
MTDPPRVCPACGGRLSPWREVAPAEPAHAATIRLLRCARCATAVTDAPVPPEAHDTGAYATHQPRLRRLAAPLLDRFDRQRLRLLAAPGPRLLDVGAGRGRFVAAARAAGFQADGIEPSKRGVRAAREHYAVDLRSEQIDSAEVAEASLDAVTLWHVLEHLDDPASALATIAGWLAPGGVILIGVPNLASWQARIGGPRWFHLDVPRHRTHFTPAGLDLLLAGAGLEPVRTTHVLAEHNPFGMWQSAVNRLTTHPSYLYNLLKRNAPIIPRDLAITLAALPLVPLAATVELAAGRSGHGGTIAVLARRVPPPR